MPSKRSTRGTAAVLVAGALLVSRIAVAASDDAHARVREAIARAVAERLHALAVVRVEGLRTSIDRPGPLAADVDPGARVGQPVRFVLRSGSQRVGMAVATLEVTAPHVTASRRIARDATIAAEDVQIVEGPLPHIAVKRLPRLDEVIGAKARRDIAAGEALTSGLVVVPPVVRTGDEVAVRVRMGTVEAVGVGRASGSGYVGDVIRVMRPGSRELRRARIVAPGAVEIVR